MISKIHNGNFFKNETFIYNANYSIPRKCLVQDLACVNQFTNKIPFMIDTCILILKHEFFINCLNKTSFTSSKKALSVDHRPLKLNISNFPLCLTSNTSICINLGNYDVFFNSRNLPILTPDQLYAARVEDEKTINHPKINLNIPLDYKPEREFGYKDIASFTMLGTGLFLTLLLIGLCVGSYICGIPKCLLNIITKYCARDREGNIMVSFSGLQAAEAAVTAATVSDTPTLSQDQIQDHSTPPQTPQLPPMVSRKQTGKNIKKSNNRQVFNEKTFSSIQTSPIRTCNENTCPGPGCPRCCPLPPASSDESLKSAPDKQTAPASVTIPPQKTPQSTQLAGSSAPKVQLPQSKVPEVSAPWTTPKQNN